MKKLIKGSRGYLNQLTKNILFHQEFENKLENQQFEIPELEMLSNRKQRVVNVNDLLPPFTKKYFEQKELDILSSKFKISVNDAIFSERVNIENIVYHSKNYRRKKSSNSYTICYGENFDFKYAELKEFFELSESVYAVINPFQVRSIDDFLPEYGHGFSMKNLNCYLNDFISMLLFKMSVLILSIAQPLYVNVYV